MSLNCVSITVSVASVASPELIVILAGVRRVLPLSQHQRLFVEVCNLIVEASESWGDK
ncbi:MAG: hypothetical protein WA305_03550 [Candidatus Acidiferrales bacterium]